METECISVQEEKVWKQNALVFRRKSMETECISVQEEKYGNRMH